MKQFHNIFASLALGMVLAFTLAGCSGKDVTLPAQLDMRPGESIALIDVAEYHGTEEVTAAQTLKMLAEAQSEGSALEFVFESDAPWVATVDEQGVITAYAVGDANITAVCEPLDFSAEVAVHVRGYATALDIEDALQLEEDATYVLNTKVDEPVAITYVSAAPNIASVDEHGVITALHNGETTITAMVPGSSLQDTCVVTVGTAVQSVSLSSAAATLAPGERMRLVAGAWPAVKTAAVWETGDETIATVKNGVVTALAAGTTEITATVGGKTAACTLTVTAPATPESATPETATAESATPEIATPVAEPKSESPAEEEKATPESAEEPKEEPTEEPEPVPAINPVEPEVVAEPEEPTEEEAATLEDYILDLVDSYANPEPELPALQIMGPGPVVPSATPETATPETATPETATPESATPETATAETATPETATPESATPETAEDALRDVEEKTGDFFSGLIEKLGSLFGF